MTPSETQDRVQAIGREFLTPFPTGWTEELWNSGSVNGWVCTAISDAVDLCPWPERKKYEARGEAATPDEARRLCREEAERKSKA